MFAGQGAQYYEMGKELYENHETFRSWMNYCDDIVAPLIQTSLIDVIYHGKGKGEPFDNILYTNPALLCIEYSLFQVLRGMGIRPDLLLGYSLGEIIAAVVAGAVSLEDGIRWVVEVARQLEKNTPPAGMLAIAAPKMIMTELPDLFTQCWITGTNFHNNFVVGGDASVIQQLQKDLYDKDITAQLLPVRYGYHTKLIDPVEDACRQLTSALKMSPGNIPVISSLTGEVISTQHQDHFWEVIRYPVNFEQAVINVLNDGDAVFIDLGPSGSLATLVKYIVPADAGSLAVPLINQFGRDLESMEKFHFTLTGLTCASNEY